MALFSRSRAPRLGKFLNTRSSVLKIASTRLSICHEADPLDAIIPILTNRFRRLPVVEKKTQDFRGLVTSVDALDYLGAGHRHWIFRKRRGSLKIPVKSIMETRILTLDKNQSIRRTLEAFQTHRRGACPILYRGKLMGMVSEWDFVKHIDSPLNIRVEELMVRKPLIVRDNFTLLDTAKIMVRSKIRRLPVAKEGILLGIVTPSDILSCLKKRRLLGRLKRDRTPVTKAMNREVRTIGPEDDVYDAARIMARKRVGGLPVVEDSELLGILTERDIVDVLR